MAVLLGGARCENGPGCPLCLVLGLLGCMCTCVYVQMTLVRYLELLYWDAVFVLFAWWEGVWWGDGRGSEAVRGTILSSNLFVCCCLLLLLYYAPVVYYYVPVVVLLSS